MNTARMMVVTLEPETEAQRAFAEQLTQETMREALRFAKERARLVRRIGRRTDPHYAHELLQDAMTDTWTGVAVWKPERIPLLHHLRGVIRRRSWREVKEAIQRPMVGLDRESRLSIHGTCGNVSPIILAALTSRVVDDLRRLAVEDRDACLVLDAWEEGHVEPDEVLAFTGLEGRAYKIARKRLGYLALDLPNSLREATRQALRSGS
jgi:hypothetical protein